jgi:hypothetical protein
MENNNLLKTNTEDFEEVLKKSFIKQFRAREVDELIMKLRQIRVIDTKKTLSQTIEDLINKMDELSDKDVKYFEKYLFLNGDKKGTNKKSNNRYKAEINTIKNFIRQTEESIKIFREMQNGYLSKNINDEMDKMRSELWCSSRRCLKAYEELLRELKHLEYKNYENALIVSDYENLSEESRKFVDDIKDEGYKTKSIRFLASKEKLGDNECEWDIMRNIFQKAIERKGYTKEQVHDMSIKILNEVRNK